jgi:hypothetical protein
MPLVLWAATVTLMVRDDRRDPFRAALEGTARYGHNHDGALTTGIVLATLEAVVLIGILRPWSYDRSWARAAVALVLWLPWTALSMVFTMHAGGVLLIHFLWLFALLCALVVTIIWSAIALLLRPRRAQRT